MQLRPGVSDIGVAFRTAGLAVYGALELKFGKGKETAQQSAFLDLIHDIGGFTCTAWSVEAVQTWIEECLRITKERAADACLRATN
jgi:hypothetical protein